MYNLSYKLTIINLIFTLYALSTKIYGFYIDSFVTPNLYQYPEYTQCLDISRNGKLTSEQYFTNFTRQTSITMRNATFSGISRHSVCLNNNFITKTSSELGNSNFDITYLFTSLMEFNNEINPFVVKFNVYDNELINMDVVMYFRLFTNKGNYTEIYSLSDYHYFNMSTINIPLFNSLNTSVNVHMFSFGMFPNDEDNTQVVFQFMNVNRENYLNYRHVITSPSTITGIYAVDNNLNTYWQTFNLQSNFTIYFPEIIFNNSILMTWQKRPDRVILGYFDNSTQFIVIQTWNRPKFTLKPRLSNFPNIKLSNLHIVVHGTGLLSEIIKL